MSLTQKLKPPKPNDEEHLRYENFREQPESDTMELSMMRSNSARSILKGSDLYQIEER